jgi:UDP-4-amino-4,6-dideoxy-N-acetyl-beta-L-altrosamine transaminase
MKSLNHGRHQVLPEDIERVVSALQGEFLTAGPLVSDFEKRLCEATGAAHAVACSNGTTALHLACLALGVEEGDVVITTPITFVASANCAEYCGARVEFVDIDPVTLCLDPKALARRCESGTIPKAVVAVDFAGVPAPWQELKALSRRFGFRLIADCAHSLGSYYISDGIARSCGSCHDFDVATLSFHPLKNITTGEGGAVLTNDAEIAAKARTLRGHGIHRDPLLLTRYDGPWYYEMHELGFNYRISDIQCALGLSQLARLDAIKHRRTEIADKYTSAFQHNCEIINVQTPESASPCYHIYPIQIQGGEVRRRRVFENLAAQGVNAQIHYIPVHLQPYYRQKYGYTEGMFPHAEEYYSRCLSLPIHCSLTDADIDRVIRSVFCALEATRDEFACAHQCL